MAIIKSTPKTFQFGTFDAGGGFNGVTVKGTDLTYDPVTGDLIGGTIRWIEVRNYAGTFSGPLPYGELVLRDLDVVDVAQLNLSQPGWYTLEEIPALMASQNGLTLTSDAYFSPLAGTDGDDIMTFTTWQARAYVSAGDGNDHVTGNASQDSIHGDAGNDTLFGYGAADWLYGGAGHDSIRGDAGDDTLWGNEGDDRIAGGAGHDLIYGDNSPYIGAPEGGNDLIFGGHGDDIIFGEEGSDVLKGDIGKDSIQGGTGNDTIIGGDGDDFLIGGTVDLSTVSDDRLFGGAGSDFMTGDLGNDALFGGSGNDNIVLVGGDDKAFGGAGNDWLVAQGSGNTLLAGGADADRFLFVVDVIDTSEIRDFNVAEDILSLGFAAAQTQAEQYETYLAGAIQQGQHVLWSDGTAEILIRRVSVDDLTLENFIDTDGYAVATY